MKKLLIACIPVVFFSCAAQAQSILSIARYADHTLALTDMPCPDGSYGKTATFNSYGQGAGRGHGCWTQVGITVNVRWLQVSGEKKPPTTIPSKDFEKVEN